MPELDFNSPDFATPITELLAHGAEHKLTPAARQLVEGDLVALAWRNSTPRTEGLTWRDIVSIEDAFQSHPFYGDTGSEEVGACCCCTCTPACCCTAVAMVEA